MVSTLGGKLSRSQILQRQHQAKEAAQELALAGVERDGSGTTPGDSEGVGATTYSIVLYLDDVHSTSQLSNLLGTQLGVNHLKISTLLQTVREHGSCVLVTMPRLQAAQKAATKLREAGLLISVVPASPTRLSIRTHQLRAEAGLRWLHQLSGHSDALCRLVAVELMAQVPDGAVAAADPRSSGSAGGAANPTRKRKDHPSSVGSGGAGDSIDEIEDSDGAGVALGQAALRLVASVGGAGGTMEPVTPRPGAIIVRTASPIEPTPPSTPHGSAAPSAKIDPTNGGGDGSGARSSSGMSPILVILVEGDSLLPKVLLYSTHVCTYAKCSPV
jgi:hypothetical protein